MVFLIDLPKLDTPNPEQTLFMQELVFFCNEQTIPVQVINDLVHYDFSATREMAFVHTVGGSHLGEKLKRTGYCGLGTALKTLGYNSGRGLEVDYVVCSQPTPSCHLDSVLRLPVANFSPRQLDVIPRCPQAGICRQHVPCCAGPRRLGRV